VNGSSSFKALGQGGTLIYGIKGSLIDNCYSVPTWFALRLTSDPEKRTLAECNCRMNGWGEHFESGERIKHENVGNCLMRGSIICILPHIL
jgi:hypothetical protein